jgi:hypothetical protein
VIALGATALIGAATLTQSSDSVPSPWCLSCGLRNPGLAADSILNVFLFVPLGVGLRLAGLRAWAVVGAALAVSLSVELMQAYAIPGRVANPVDLATNTIGAGVAAVATPRWRTAIFPSAKAARFLSLLSMAGLIAIVAVSTCALAPDVPRAPLTVRGVDAGAAPMPRERVLTGVVDGRAVRSGDTVPAPGPLVRPIGVEIELQASRSRWRGEPALELVAGDRTFLWLGIDQNELELEMRRKGEAARFLSPTVRVSRPVRHGESAPAARLDTLRLRAVAARWRMSLTTQTRDARDDAAMQLHALSGWSLLLRAPRSPRLVELLTALWAGALFFPVVYWGAAASAGGSRSLIVAVLSVCIAGVWAAGAVVGAPGPSRSAIIGAVVAALGAWGLQRTIKRRDHVASAS